MKKQKVPKFKKLTAMLLALTLAAVWMPNASLTAKAEDTTAATVSNPVIVEDSSMSAGRKVTYNCIYFGSYPQTEIVKQASDCGVYEKIREDTDFVADEDLYKELANAEEWDNNEITLDGVKYRRIEKSDATYVGSNGSFYYWTYSTAQYHYFRYDPIKWRVLNVDGDQAFLLSDITLDTQKFNASETGTYWDKSTLRSWLNGYDASENDCGIDYSGDSFLGSAFSTEEQNAILDTFLNNKVTSASGDNTQDKVFCLSKNEVDYTDECKSYGFIISPELTSEDEARQCYSSCYAKAMGVYTWISSDCLGQCYWWMRAASLSGSYYAGYVNVGGSTWNGYPVDRAYCGVRPALKLDLSSSLWSIAGTVCTDGTSDPHGMGHVPAVTKCTATCTEGGVTESIVCSVCGETLKAAETVGPLGHVEVIDQVEVPATCTSTGLQKESHCSRCGEILFERIVTPALGHKYVWEEAIAATLTLNGSTAECYCENCGKVMEAGKSIPRIKTVSLSYTTAVYSGSAKSPTVKIYDKNGKQLTENIDYILSKPSGRKNVGVYNYKVTFFGNYAGTKTLTLTINPKGTTISKLTALSKSFKVTWKKYSTQTSGYQLQYSTSSAFKSAKTVTVSGTSTTAKTIKSLKAKTKYYVRIRTYKKVSGKTYYSAWSAKKYVKTK